MTQLEFPDPQGYADLASLVARARRANPDGAVRLHASGTLLRVYVEVLAGQALFADGAVVGVRGTRLAAAIDLDVTVASAALAERFAHRREGTVLPVPPAGVAAPWAGALPPSGEPWELLGELPSRVLDEVAGAGIAALNAAAAHPATLPAERDRVWAAPAPTDPALPAGAAFGCRVLGFLVPGERVTVYRRGRWSRVRTARGHVLAR